MEVSEEDQKIVEEELKDHGKVEANSSGLLPLDAYIKIQKSITKLTFKTRNDTELKHTEERRELLK
jgi:hypothetical protein